METAIKAIMTALEQPNAYPHPTNTIQRIITGVSVVFLTGTFAYKFNKPLNLGFLDFSTLEKRKEQCDKEVYHNSKITPDFYLGVVPITRDETGLITIEGKGEIIEYAVKMKQLDPMRIMKDLLKKNAVTTDDCRRLAQKIFAFHQRALTNETIAAFGLVEAIQYNWNENFAQTIKERGSTIADNDFQFIQEKINYFIGREKGLLHNRVLKREIKHCHGDFHLGNVFIMPQHIYIFDGIVFNQRFPCSDVIAEIAFMVMDLEFHEHNDLAQVFLNEYQRLSNDADIPLLLDFYKCYRAYIRAKIHCFTAADHNLTLEDQMKEKEMARQYFTLAKNYAALLK